MKHLQFLLLCAGLGAVAPVTAQQTMAPYTFEWEVAWHPGHDDGEAVCRAQRSGRLFDVGLRVGRHGGLHRDDDLLYQDEDWVTPNNNNPLLFDILSSLRYDSWVTIGRFRSRSGWGIWGVPPKRAFGRI